MTAELDRSDPATAWMKRVGHAIRRERTKRALGREEVATRIGSDPGYLGRIECGAHNVTIVTIARIARGLGVHPAVLMLDEMEVTELVLPSQLDAEDSALVEG